MIEVLKKYQQIALFRVAKFTKCINVSTKFADGLSFIKFTNMAALEYLSILLIISKFYSANLYMLICTILRFYTD